MHYNASSDETRRAYGLPQPAYNTEFVEAIVTEAQRVNGNRPTGRVPVLPWVWYRYIYDHTTLLQPVSTRAICRCLWGS